MKLAHLNSCTACPRLATHLAACRHKFPDYHARPVAAFGDPAARLLIVGLAPGMHGANATGRPFTGDYAGILLYDTLYRFGYANQSMATSAADGMQLTNCRITNAVKCLPPANKPTTAEIKTCNRYLTDELRQLPVKSVILALGVIAHQAVLRALALPVSAYPFRHAARYRIPSGPMLLDSYHCSRYNTQTRRLTPVMFRKVIASIEPLLRA